MDEIQIDSKQFDDFKKYMDKLILTVSSISELGINSDTMYHLDEKFDNIIASLNSLVSNVEKISYTLSEIKDKIYYINASIDKISSSASEIDNKIKQ